MKALDKRIVKALHAKGERLKLEGAKKGGKIAGRGRPKSDSSSSESVEKLLEPFDAQQEQLKSAAPAPTVGFAVNVATVE